MLDINILLVDKGYNITIKNNVRFNQICLQVWNELIPNMDVRTLLDNFQRISSLGFLKSNNITVMKVVDVLNNLWKAETFKGHPSRVFIELVTYDKAAK